MPLTVRQLASRPELATRIVAGASGADGAIDWAHVCELRDPWQWVGEGDLLMTTGLGIPVEADAQAEYVERLAAVQVAGVAIGENMNAPPLQQRMYDAADRHGLPLMLTRYEIPFIALARAVSEANTEAHLARIEQTERVYEVLRRSSEEELDLAELVEALEEVVGCRLFVVDAAHARSLVPGRQVPESAAEMLSRWSPGERHAPSNTSVAVSGGQVAGVVVPSPRGAVLIATPTSGAVPDPSVMRHMAAATALHQTRQFAERERSLRLGAALLAQLLDQRIGTAAARTALAGVDLGGTDLLLAACLPAENQDLNQLHHRLEDAEITHLMLTRPPLSYVLLRDDPGDVSGLVGALPDGATAGISDPVDSPTELPTAQRQARWALHRAQERRLAVLHHSDDLGDSVFLPGDRDDSRAAASRVLGRLMEYDDAHRAELVESLGVFLQENRSWQRAAARLHVHKQTLVYRMRRVEELTGRDLSDTADVAELWLALQAAVSSGLVDR
jgi:PucR family transcriptional regulator, purine catabolism regulatory protein